MSQPVKDSSTHSLLNSILSGQDRTNDILREIHAVLLDIHSELRDVRQEAERSCEHLGGIEDYTGEAVGYKPREYSSDD